MAKSFIPAEREQVIDRLRTHAYLPGSRVLVTGEPGIGKSFALERAIEPLAESDHTRVLFARGHSSDFALAYQGLHDLFADVPLDELPIPESHRESLSFVLLRSHTEKEVSASAVAVAVDAALTSMSSTARLVLALDDIDRLDDETSLLLGYVMTRPGRRATDFSVVASATSALFAHDGGRAIQRFPATDILHIGPLGPDDLHRVVGSTAENRVSSLQKEVLHAESMGNPTCAIEILSLTRGIDAPQLAKAGADALIGMRLGEIGDTSRAILAICALTSHPTTDQVVDVLNLTPTDIPALVERGLVRQLDGRLFPVHDLFARAALDSLSAPRLASLHASLAETAPEQGMRAHHRDRSTPPGPDDALADDLAAAAEGMRRRGVPTSEADLLLRSLARTRPDHPSHAARAIRAGELLHQLGEYPRCIAVLAMVALDEVDLELFDRAILPLLSSYAAAEGELTAMGKIAALRETAGDDLFRSAILDIGQAVIDGSDLDPDRTSHALAVLETTHDASVSLRRGLGALIHATMNAGHGLDDGVLARITALETDTAVLSVADSAEAFLGMHAYQVGRIEESRRALESARRRALDAGETIAAGRFAVHLATIDTITGRTRQADVWLEEWDAVDPWPASPPPPVLAVRGTLALMRGDGTAFDAVLASPPPRGNPKKDELYRLAMRGHQATRDTQWGDALIYLTSARHLADSMGIREPGARLNLDFSLGRAQIALDRTEEARASIEALERLPGDRPLITGVALRLRGLIAAHESKFTEAERLFRASVAALPPDAHRAEACLSLLELASLLLRTVANRAEAVALLTAAEEAALSADDQILASRVREMRVVADTPSFVDLLTPREHVVALAAGAGTSNKEIAASNFISVRTVETQLSSVYRKLGLRSRSDLIEALRRKDTGA